jgi:membrane protease YdiL (CAAX protease family)
MATLERLYAAYDAGQWRPFAPDSEEAKFLQQQFGWFGKLALSPGQAPPDKGTILPRAEVDRDNQRTFLAMMGAVVVGLGMLALGFCALVVLTILAAMGTIKSNVQCGSYHHAVYAETFALWMVLFVALQIVTGLTAPRGWQLGAAGLGALISLIVLAWPVLRGLPWRTVRADIGLTSGRAPLLEPLFGFGSYLASLPILAVSLLLVLFLLAIVGGLQTLLPDNGNPFEPTGGPTHPIIESFVRPSWSGLLQIFFAASIAAPIVEEIMFRGFLYRHLRETTRGLGTALSFIASALVGSFIFAVIHPQGIVLVPALMALAFGFTIAREWRGTVYPGMIAHGVHNGLLMTFVLVALS